MENSPVGLILHSVLLTFFVVRRSLPSVACYHSNAMQIYCHLSITPNLSGILGKFRELLNKTFRNPLQIPDKRCSQPQPMQRVRRNILNPFPQTSPDQRHAMDAKRKRSAHTDTPLIYILTMNLAQSLTINGQTGCDSGQNGDYHIEDSRYIAIIVYDSHNKELL